MIINTAPANSAVLSNVDQVSEFRIRSTAKSFSILSSGLYGNKIRAVVRELSTNAYDSHVDAGRKDKPFVVHLPNAIEPWFSVADNGTGLDDSQVNGIYTTYFESSKTGSNDFVGALGLGSKSPFSYTDNFTVTSVKNSIKGIYSVFINEHGVPSIARLFSGPTDEQSGVEVKFAVTKREDFNKFRYESQSVYAYFPVKPVDSVGEMLTVDTRKYTDRDIIPGVHTVASNRYVDEDGNSVAVMGNIAYPITMPDGSLPDQLRKMLRCGLEMHFAIGELDFQASREGLSYIPQTVNAIKDKLLALSAKLADHLTVELAAIENKWELAETLLTRHAQPLWAEAVGQYLLSTNFDLIDTTSSYGPRRKTVSLLMETLASDYNIIIRAFRKNANNTIQTLLKDQRDTGRKNAEKRIVYGPAWDITVDTNVTFVTNSGKIGATERAKYHWNNVSSASRGSVFVVEPADKSKPADFAKFFAMLQGPNNIIDVTTLEVKPKVVAVAEKVNILTLTKKSSNRWAGDTMTWQPGGTFDTFDITLTHYYVPLSGFSFVSKYDPTETIYEIEALLSSTGIPEFQNIKIHGVRKTDQPIVAAAANWKNLEDHVAETLKVISNQLLLSAAIAKVDDGRFMCYNKDIATKIINPNSKYLTVTNKMKDVTINKNLSSHFVDKLIRIYHPAAGTTPDSLVDSYNINKRSLYKQYPLLDDVKSYFNEASVAQYINLIDAQ